MSDKPEFGYGAGGRLLWTVRDRHAEVIRTVLRKVGRREFVGVLIGVQSCVRVLALSLIL
ncbi:hypothetical protein [Nonomuraea jabiensis]|uniref:hypothetical protein n=1 Tax=Nonomuraea jabiensis TaxID=882448 RepID=UPI003699227F